MRRQLVETPGLNRSHLADRICDELGFLDPRGRRQRSGCVKALRVLEARGLFVLPARCSSTGPSSPLRHEAPVPRPHDVPEQVERVRGLELVLVQTEEQRRIWNALLLDEHPRGAGPLVGRQLRYLVGSEHGWLGAFAFASAALHLEARDRWIGWSLEARREFLDKIVGMARFLIRPSVTCRNLASRLLGMVVEQMPQDFETIYGYRPWVLETFVDTERHSGTCYRAANWQRIGQTQGRGRQDRDGSAAETVKDVYLHVLVVDFRERLGLRPLSGLGPLPLDASLEAESWAEQEFGGAALGDARLGQRLVRIAAALGANPTLSLPGAVKGDKQFMKGYYRFIDHPDEQAIDMEGILAPHREQTIRRMKAQRVVLCIQDGTSLDYSGASECTGLGFIGSNQTGAKSQGLHLHSTLAVTDDGVPLGVLRGHCSAPQSREPGRPAARHIAIEEKETYDWVLGLQDCEAIAAEMPHTRIMQVMDREADFFELFDAWRSGPRRTHLLIRAQHNRRTTGDFKLFDQVKATPPRSETVLHIGRKSARPKRSKQKASPKRDERDARMTLRYSKIAFAPPRGQDDKEPISLWLVHLAEEQPPEGVRPVEWFLLTTSQVESPEQALELLEWYCLRWRIEDWHRVLKSGCKVEDLRNESAERIKRALAIYLVIAWRILLMTLLGREGPELPADVLFSDLELEVLHAYAKTRRDLKPPTNLMQAVHIVGTLGGFVRSKSNPHPGAQTLWLGYSQLRFMSMGYLLGRSERPD